MMILYLMRHGIAVSADEPTISSDADRPLTPKGVKRLRKAAKGLAKLKIPFSAVLTSPLLRARQTAEIVAQTLTLEERLEEISGLAPESSVEQLMFGLTRFHDREHLLLIGHEPLLSSTASFLLFGKTRPALGIRFRKGGLCCIEVDELPPKELGLLHWHLTAKQLRLFASKRSKS
jgi:phosphohistidine phosphatase